MQRYKVYPASQFDCDDQSGFVIARYSPTLDDYTIPAYEEEGLPTFAQNFPTKESALEFLNGFEA